MRTAFCVAVGVGVVGAWVLTWASHRLEDYLDGLLDNAEAVYQSKRMAAEMDRLACEEMEAQFDA